MSEIEKLKAEVVRQNNQITLLIQSVAALKRTTELITSDLNESRWYDPFEEVSSKLSDLEFRQGIEE